jgi:hypothetical protein
MPGAGGVVARCGNDLAGDRPELLAPPRVSDRRQLGFLHRRREQREPALTERALDRLEGFGVVDEPVEDHRVDHRAQHLVRMRTLLKGMV